MPRAILGVTRLYGLDPAHSRLACRAKFLIRALAQWPNSIRWFRFLQTQPQLAPVLHQQSQWLHKLQRPYLCTGHSAKQKLRLLQQHFELFFRLFPQALYSRLLKEPSVLMAKVDGKSGASYRIELGLARIMDKEGELLLTLVPETTRYCLATMAFSFGRNTQGKPTIFIGCLQGPKCADGHRQFKEVTKDLHGLMPKILMFKILCMLARKLDIDSVMGVSNQAHVHNSASRHYKKIHFDYDAFWGSLGGIKAECRYFLLRAQIKERPLADIPSHKRAQYQRRRAIETQIENQCYAALTNDQSERDADAPIVVTEEAVQTLPFSGTGSTAIA